MLNNDTITRASFLAIGVGLFGCARLPTVVPISKAEASEDYAFYALPRTVLVVTTKGTVTEVNPKARCIAPAYDDLRKDLGLELPKHGGSTFSISEVTISKRTEADPNEVYAVELDRLGTNAVALKSSPAGLPSAASGSSTDAVIPPITAGLGLVASIIGKFFGAPEVKSATDVDDPCVQAKAQILALREEVRPLYSSVGAADSKEVLEYKKAKLEVAIKTMEGWFTGVELGKPKDIVCEVRPVPGTTEYELFSYTRGAGVDLSEPKGCDFAATFAAAATGGDQAKLTAVHTLKLSVSPVTSLAAAIDGKALPDADARSFFYRVPGYATILVNDGGERLTSAVEWPVAQLGHVRSLPRLSAGGSIELAVGFDPETGALIDLSVKRQAADIAGQLSKLSDSAGGLIGAIRTDAAKNEELIELQEQQALLEARVAIAAAKDALGE